VQHSWPGRQASAPQQVLPAAPHRPPQQTPPTPQVTPPSPAQPPQLVGSVSVSTHWPPHFTLPSGHCFLVHTQVWRSSDRPFLHLGTQPLPHLTVPSGQGTHESCAETPRPPVRRRTVPAGQPSTHCPPSHVCPAAQQASPQRVVPGGQRGTQRSRKHSYEPPQQAPSAPHRV
jgi:hypothetical protein